MEIFYLIKFVLFQVLGLFIALGAGAVFVFLALKKAHSLKLTILLSIFFLGAFLFFFLPNFSTRFSQYPFSLSTSFGSADGPSIPLKNILTFFRQFNKFEKVANIARDPNDIPPPINRDHEETIKLEMETKEVVSEIAPGIYFNYWTFDGQVPGPFVRVREGDTVELTLKNSSSSIHMHSIDLHAVTGPGGGATVTDVAPAESKTFKFKALNPGLYVYHCAHPNVPSHMTHGMYGLILVEPKDGLPPVDKEFYVMQGEFYTAGGLGNKGLQVFDGQAMLDGHPQYIVFNGKVKSLVDNMNVKVGDRVRMYVGNGGVNLISSFHVIGEIFDTVYPEASIGGALFKNVQTTAVPAGGAAIVDFKMDVPGKYILVDHALARLDRGLWGVMQASGNPRTQGAEQSSYDGEPNKEIFDGEASHGSAGH